MQTQLDQARIQIQKSMLMFFPKNTKNWIPSYNHLHIVLASNK